MAAVTFNDQAVTGSLGATTADTVTMTNPGPFELTNLDAVNAVWVRLDGQVASIFGVNCIPVLGGRVRVFNVTAPTFSIFPGAATPQYVLSRVIGIQPSMT